LIKRDTGPTKRQGPDERRERGKWPDEKKKRERWPAAPGQELENNKQCIAGSEKTEHPLKDGRNKGTEGPKGVPGERQDNKTGRKGRIWEGKTGISKEPRKKNFGTKEGGASAPSYHQKQIVKINGG